LQHLTYQPRRGGPARRVSEDGRLLHSIGEPGIYRLAESSAADLQAILAGPPGEPIPQYQARKPRAIPAGTALSSDHEPGSTTASRQKRTFGPRLAMHKYTAWATIY
jgi:hypothetical protein